MKLEDLSIEQLKNGYIYDPSIECYTCLTCNSVFEAGRMYSIGDNYYDAKHGIKMHMKHQHPEYPGTLIDNDSKYNTLTDNQKQLFHYFCTDKADKDIAGELGVSTSTIRHQKFMFREKAKQAKLYLAIYESVFAEKQKDRNAIVPVHDHAKMLDERYIVTEQERDSILQGIFSSLAPLKLKLFSRKEKKKVVALSRIAEEFEMDKRYTEKQVNVILESIYYDYVTLRRYLIEYGFMDRTKNGSEYWRT